MIYTSLHTIVQELNEFLKLKFSTDSPQAILGSLLNESGTPREENQNKIILTLVNVEQEASLRNTLSPRNIDYEPITQNRAHVLNLDVLVTAVFSDYGEALKCLSTIIYFFQAKSFFTPENSPRMDPSLQKITFEQLNMSYSDRESLWTTLGTAYQPSVLFKARMISFDNGEIEPILYLE